MITGAFSFLLYLFSSPQAVLTHQLEGAWEVTVDSTDTYRAYWHKVYLFDKCEDRASMACQGSFGFVDEPDVLTNQWDKAYFIYGVTRKRNEKVKSRILYIDDEPYFFTFSEHRNSLVLKDESQHVVLRMIRRD